MKIVTVDDFLRSFRRLPAESREQIIEAIRSDMGETTRLPELMTDSEVAKLLRISPVTLSKYVREGPPRRRNRNVFDIRLVRHVSVGGVRRWYRKALLAILGNGEGE